VAAFLASLTFAALGLRPAANQEPANVPSIPEEAALWTPAIGPAVDLNIPRDVSPDRLFALPGTTARPTGAIVIPDVAFLTREYPKVVTLHVFGDGLSYFDADTLRRIRVVFHSGAENLSRPAINFVRLPSEVSVGDPIIVQGHVQGIATGASPVLSISSPDGVARAVTLAPAENGVATFSLSAAPTMATGHFVWRLELRGGEAGDVLAHEEVGVSVIQPVLPRILILESSPRIDTGRLRRWLGERGAVLTIRTQLGRDRFRISTSHGSRDAVEAIDSGALGAFDLVLADAGALAALSEAEREALRAAISEEGLGVLIVADESLFEPGAAQAGGTSRDEFFFPGKLIRGAKDVEGDDRLSRLRWPGSESASPESLPLPNYEIEPGAQMQPLVRDGQDRTLVAVAGRGRGRLALSLVTQTWRWTQLKDSGSFAAYWSFLFSELARPTAERAGRWSIASDGSGPQFVNEPVVLRWSGAGDRTPMPAQVSAEGNETPARLALAQSPVDASQWQAAYWPRRAGWNQVSAPGGGATLDFHVSEAGAWPSLQATRRRAATSRVAAAFVADESAPAARASPTPVEVGRWWFYAILFACLTYLWAEARVLRQSSQITSSQ
jgi:hypothetical protein